jgi:hypothetical protein
VTLESCIDGLRYASLENAFKYNIFYKNVLLPKLKMCERETGNKEVNR